MASMQSDSPSTPRCSGLQLPDPGETWTKKDFRKAIKQGLSSLSEDEIQQQSRATQNALLDMPEYRKCQSISIFMSMPKGEVQTKEIVYHALKSGKKVFIPYIYKSHQSNVEKPVSTMDMLQLRDEHDYQSLVPDRWGIPSIDAGTVADRINCLGGQGLSDQHHVLDAKGGLDVVLVPAVAFDQKMNRLGHGKGYYDDFLARYHKLSTNLEPTAEKPYLIGLVLEDQVLPSQYRLPVESWDRPVDTVIHGGHIISQRSSTPDSDR